MKLQVLLVTLTIVALSVKVNKIHWLLYAAALKGYSLTSLAAPKGHIQYIKIVSGQIFR